MPTQLNGGLVSVDDKAAVCSAIKSNRMHGQSRGTAGCQQRDRSASAGGDERAQQFVYILPIRRKASSRRCRLATGANVAGDELLVVRRNGVRDLSSSETDRHASL